MKRYLFLILFCLGCSSKPKAPVIHIQLVNNYKAIEIKGLNFAIASEINRDSSLAAWQSFLPVYRMPADTGLKDYQPVLHGLYTLKDSVVVFTPDTPFSKEQTYFLRCYQFGGGNNAWDFVRGKKKLGGTKYTDLIFK
jgi:hypothetical protein